MFLITVNEILKLIAENLSEESKLLLYTLNKETTPINKEHLRDKSNDFYLTNRPDSKKLIHSRFVLDIHTARLEGAALVKVTEMGRARLYMITDLGKALIEFLKK